MARQKAPFPAVEISLCWFGRSYRIAFRRWIATGLLALAPVVLATGTFSIVDAALHDQGLTALLTRDTDIEDAYEDRVAALRSQLEERVGSNNPPALDAAIRAIDARSARLEARAAMIEAQLADANGRRTSVAGRRPATPLDIDSLDVHPAPSLGAGSPAGLRLGEAMAPGAAVSDGGGLSSMTALNARLTQVETRQAAALKRLSEPLVAHIGQVRAALGETGLPSERWDERGGIGGPFVPASMTEQGFDVEQGIGLLRAARSEAARLDAVALGVPLRRPLDGPLDITSVFGVRLDPFYGRPALHTGIDLLASSGTGVQATANGIVTMAGPDGGYGNMVEVDHGRGVATRYAHLSAITVTLHQKIAAGDLLGHVGSSGRATGPHLHYETRIDGEPVDPTRFLKAGAPLQSAPSPTTASQP